MKLPVNVEYIGVYKEEFLSAEIYSEAGEISPQSYRVFFFFLIKNAKRTSSYI